MGARRHRLPQQRVGDYIDPDPEDAAELLADPRDAEQCIAPVGFEIHQKVDVACGSGIAASHRAEDARVAGPITVQHVRDTGDHVAPSTAPSSTGSTNSPMRELASPTVRKSAQYGTPFAIRV